MKKKEYKNKATMHLDNYGDNFDNGCINLDENSKSSSNLNYQKYVVLIFIGAIFLVVITVFITLYFSSCYRDLYNQNLRKNEALFASSITSNSPTSKALENSQNNDFENTLENGKVIEENTDIILAPTEITRTEQTTIFTEAATENVSEIVTEDSSGITDFILPDSVPTEGTSTYIQDRVFELNLADDSKSIQVNNITAKKASENICNIFIIGEFDGYQEDELMSLASIEVTDGSYISYLPSISSDKTKFSFILNLENASGILSINLDSYYFSQSISSIT